jgi:hypothetical protein
LNNRDSILNKKHKKRMKLKAKVISTHMISLKLRSSMIANRVNYRFYRSNMVRKIRKLSSINYKKNSYKKTLLIQKKIASDY